ncbi:hypothetical protein AC1031_002212 [Aphanomyces cochlioides]|nr:hypothetical protein AC1031_002212 [Aphanomyces cochlioides]
MPDEGNQQANDASSDDSSTDGRQSRYTKYFESTQVVGTQESRGYRTAFKAGLCDHLYPISDRCQMLRDQCPNYQSGSHPEQCRWVTTKNGGVRCKSAMATCHHHNWWLPVPKPGTLRERVVKYHPEVPKPPGRKTKRELQTNHGTPPNSKGKRKAKHKPINSPPKSSAVEIKPMLI